MTTKRIAQLEADLERARSVAVALEQQLARVEALLPEFEWDAGCCEGHAGRLRAALEADDA